MTTRRQFFHLVSGALAGAALPAWARSGGIAPLSLGMSLYGMKGLPLDEGLAQCARIGFRNVELGIDPGYPADPRRLSAAARRDLRHRLEALGLPVTAQMLNIRLDGDDAAQVRTLEAIKEAAGLAHDVSPDRPPPIETIMGGKPPQWEGVKDKMAERLRVWGETAAAAGIEIAVKAHVNMAVNSPDRLLWILGQAGRPEIKVAFDYSHFELGGYPLEACWAALGSRTIFVHVKDTQGTAKKFRFLLPGEGRTPYPRYFRMLKDTGYTGPVVVEVSTQIFSRPGYDPVAAAEKSYAALARAMAEAGVAQGPAS